MPAGFNNGQIEYIKSIANVNGHKTYKPIQFPFTRATIDTNHLTLTQDTHLKFNLFSLHKNPLVYGAGAITAATEPVAVTATELNALSVTPVNDETPDINQRQGAEGFLESTHLRIRCLLDNPSTGGFTGEHNEYRMIVFRHKERQHSSKQFAENFSNPYYDLFQSLNGYKIGFSGYRAEININGNIDYSNSNLSVDYGTKWVDAQSAMTFPVNTSDYVVMKDHRFFLGASYGGKNMFETSLHWDWKDPIATTKDDLTTTESNKNYSWYILIMGNSNNTLAGATLNITIAGNTHMTSG